jgi:hypothetical protein
MKCSNYDSDLHWVQNAIVITFHLSVIFFQLSAIDNRPGDHTEQLSTKKCQHEGTYQKWLLIWALPTQDFLAQKDIRVWTRVGWVLEIAPGIKLGIKADNHSYQYIHTPGFDT